MGKQCVRIWESPNTYLRSSHRVAAGQSNSSSVSIFQVSCLATNVAPASWSKPAATSFTFPPSVHLRVVVVTRSFVSPLCVVAIVTNCRKNCCCCCAGVSASGIPSASSEAMLDMLRQGGVVG